VRNSYVYAVGLAIGALSAACSAPTNALVDSVVVPTRTIDTTALPRQGVYDVSTTLTQFSYELGCTASLYCVYTFPLTTASLSGWIVIDTLGVGGPFSGAFCTEHSYSPTGGCVTVTPQGERWYSTPTRLLSGSKYFSLTPLPAVAFPPTLWFDIATFGGDSITGTVRWTQTTGRFPPVHTGLFVARRRK
jgi:hypothetical protein